MMMPLLDRARFQRTIRFKADLGSRSAHYFVGTATRDTATRYQWRRWRHIGLLVGFLFLSTLTGVVGHIISFLRLPRRFGQT
jgi:hypothetical protein